MASVPQATMSIHFEQGAKDCFKCKRRMPLSEFYRHSQMGDGHLGKCRACTRADVKANRLARREHYATYDRARARLAKRAEASRAYSKTSHARYPEKSIARNALWTALRAGRIKRMPCEVCGNRKVQGHHRDYSKPLDVRWLCSRHHADAHSGLIVLEVA